MNKTAGEVRTNTYKMFSSGLLRIDVLVLVDHQRLIYISLVRTLDAIYRTCQEDKDR